MKQEVFGELLDGKNVDEECTAFEAVEWESVEHALC